MPENLKDRLEFSYENIGAASYLVVKAGLCEDIIDYQVSMTGCNKIDRLLQYDMKSINGYAYCYYNITSRLQLSFFLKHRKLSRNEFIKLLADTARTVTDSAGYLLSDTGFLLDPDYIYINPDNLELEMVYVPIKANYDSLAVFREFVQKLILQLADIDDSAGDNFLQRIIAFVKNDLFNLSDFLKLLDSLLYSGEGKEAAIAEDEAATSEEICQVPAKPEVKHEDRNNKVLAAALLFQALLVVIVLLAVKFIRLSGGNSFADYMALLLIVIAADILIMKNILKGVKVYNKFRDRKLNEATPPVEFNPCPKLSMAAEGQEIKRIIPASSNKTVLLGNVKPDFPVLKSKDGKGVDIEINKPDFIVGRLEGQVDHVCNSPAVGKIHALIMKRNDTWFIKDLNSVNGTFINNSRITSNVEHPVKDGDVVAFANCEYVFGYF